MPDPNPPPAPPPGDASPGNPSPGDTPPSPPPKSPYGNLFVPLIVVPALIVMVLVLVGVLFGNLLGSEPSLEDNLRRVRYGGANDRTQALFGLVRQLEENWSEYRETGQLAWEMEPEFLPTLEAAWTSTDADDLRFRYVLAACLAQLGAPGAIDKLLACLDAAPEDDPDGEIRFHVLYGLGVLAGDLEEEDRRRVHAAILRFADDEDAGLQHIAAMALQNLPGEETLAALRGLLAHGRLDLRGQAAISLSHLGDASGAAVLWELMDAASYERERAKDPEKFRRESTVRDARKRAARSLFRLGRPGDIERLRELSESEPDPEVREVLLAGLDSRA